MRPVLFLAVAAAATVMVGALLMAASAVLRHVSKHPPVSPAYLARIGLDVVAAGLAFGLVVLVLFAVGRLGRSRRSKLEATVPGDRQETPRPEPHGHARPSGHGAPRSSRRPVNPTNVYTPGGLIDVPRDGPAPGTPGGPPIPEILRTVGPVPNGPLPGGQVPGGSVPGGRGPVNPGPGGPGPGGPPGGRGQDWLPPGRAGSPPRPGYQPGMNPPNPGRAPYGPGGAPGPSRDHMRQREAPRHGQPMPGPPMPGQPMPGRPGMPRPEPGMPRPESMPGAGVPPRGAPPHQPQAPRPGPAGPMRDSGLFRDGVPREGMGPGGPAGPGRPGGGPLPPRDPAYPPGPGHGAGYAPGPGQGPGPGQRPGPGPSQGPGPVPGPGPRQGGGPGRHARGPGYNAAGGRRPGAPRPEPGEPAGEFDGGYAKVIRASDSPVRPARRPGPGRPPGDVPADVFVYRDTEDQSADTGRRPSGPDDPSYWYDLAAAGPAEETVPVPEETRGPFEPLVSSGTVRGAAADPAAAPEAAAPAEGQPGDPVQAQARKLEQIKDLYLTAEAIGESNVDKHFDQLLAQQRELISDYFKQSSAPPGHDPGGQAAGSPGIPPPAAGGSGSPADPAESTRVTADQPRVW